MSPTENTSMDRLRILAQMSGNKEIGLDLRDLEEIEKGQNDIRERLESMQRDLQLLSSAA